MISYVYDLAEATRAALLSRCPLSGTSGAVKGTVLKRSNQTVRLAAVIFIISTTLYAHTWGYGFTYLDDNDIVLSRAETLASPAGLVLSFTHRYFVNNSNLFYRPLVNLSFVLDAQLAGTGPWIYHVTNGLLHATACVLLFSFLRSLKLGNVASTAAALLFSVHPMHVSSVAWIPGRNDVLLTCFALAAMVLLIKSASQAGPMARTGHLLCFLAALLCKETAVCLPIVFVALLLVVAPGRVLAKRGWLAFGWATVLAAYFIVRSNVLAFPVNYSRKLLHTAFGNVWVLVSDIGKLVLPVRLQVLYTPKDILLWPGIVVIGAVVAIACFRRQMRPRIVLLACALSIMPLLMGLLATDFIVLENRLYLPIAGACLLVGELIRTVLNQRPRSATAVIAVVTSLCVVLSVVTINYSKRYRDRDHFAEAAIKAAPGSYLAMRLNFMRSFSGYGGHRRTEAARNH